MSVGVGYTAQQSISPSNTRPSTDGSVYTGQALVPHEPELTPVMVRPGVIFKNTTAEAVAPLQIRTPARANYFVKLVDVDTGRQIMGIYVIGGQTLDVDVPLGRYEMRYASGQAWYGVEHRFGPDTSYAKADKIFDFGSRGNKISGYTVDLILQVNGNLHTHRITADQF